MTVPRLNVRLALEAPERQGDGMGGHAVVWRRLGWLWGAMDAGAGRERFAEVGPESVVAWRITLRGAPAGDQRRPAAGQRLRLGARLFRIEAVAERDPEGRWLTCFAREEDAT
ncbi:head-tail adaptor protein [Paracoccus spongiarum]|uniref:Head-tail adaptor protein n=1 Tax=Paracoccus spongiarum TaxID=3064387 RepID=A0ABT9J7P2_9RHOB|nr:head-tail adaptor protein [Paracoccus sp. 2205BS29-5]MDP5305655.1 head-tail adaptor protein [Paracoccus sp. 2205BS29-5]